MSRLADVFLHARETANALLSAGDAKNIEIEERDLEGAIVACRRAEPYDAIVRRLSSWRLEPIVKRLQRAEAHARDIATRLGKPPPWVVIEDRGIRLPREGWSSFWSAFTHVVRNAMHHGIEDPTTRAALGKPAQGRLTITAANEGGALVVEVVDDGRGIDWKAIARKAKERGIPTEGAAALTEALFASGVSTARGVDEAAGRGVGMGAIRSACVAQGGRMEVESMAGEGTCIRMIFPGLLAADVEGRVGWPADANPFGRPLTARPDDKPS